MDVKKNRTLVLVSGSLILFCLGIIYIWSIFQSPAMEYYGWDTSAASLTFSILMVAFVAGILLGGRWQDKSGPRPVVLTGGVMFAAGLLVSSAAPADAGWVIYVMYGGVAGVGVGAAYTSLISCIQKWFPDKRGLATGVVVCSFGASTVVFSPVANTLLASYSLHNTWRIMAIAFFVVIIVFVWFIKNPPEGANVSKKPVTQYQFTANEALHTKQLYMLLILMMLITPAYFILNPMLKILGTAKGLSEAAAVAGVSITGAASAAGRLVFPAVSDVRGRKFSMYLMYIITLVATLLLPFAESWAYIVCIALITFCYGGSSGVFPAVTADYYGTRSQGANYGMVMLGFAAAALIFPAVAGVFQKTDIESPWAFIIPAIACAVGILLTIPLKAPEAPNAAGKK